MDDHDEGCSCAIHSAGVSQTLQELEFERGVWRAASEGDRERVERLLGKGSSPNAKDSSGYTSLHYACRNGHVEICQVLVSSGADLNAQTPGGATGLHRAAYCGHCGVVQFLLKEEADGALIDSDGKTPLHKACEGGRVEVAGLLAAKFPDTLRMRDKRGRLPGNLVTSWNDEWTHTLSH